MTQVVLIRPGATAYDEQNRVQGVLDIPLSDRGRAEVARLAERLAEPGPAGRSAGSLAWAGLFNTYFWLDPNKRVTGTIMTQLLPFADDQVLKLFAKFESGLYAAVA